jgi:hypothetical protein
MNQPLVHYLASRDQFPEFFEHENQKFPPSLSQNGSLNTGVKSQLMSILETGHEMPNSVPTVDSLVIDGASLVYSP